MQSTCSFPGCDRPARITKLCNGHYTQRRRGKNLTPIERDLTPEERFWAKVRKNTSSGCWEWVGSTSRSGYGTFWYKGRTGYAHRISWELSNPPIPDGMLIDHRCANTICVNPAHLRIANASQNSQHLARLTRANTSGARGVYWSNERRAWYVQAQFEGKTYWGGFHSNFKSAVEASVQLRSELYTHDDHDEWLRQQKDIQSIRHLTGLIEKETS